MARPLRVEHEGAVYHILSKGNRGEYIFHEDGGKEYFLHVLQSVAERYAIELYAYCIMGNHYHLLIGVPVGMLSRVMHTIQSAYGSYLRREKGWIGHVFAGRYKSLCVEKEGYLLELSRYIHLNPVRAGIAKKPEEYQWSSYQYYAGKDNKPEWLHMEWLLQEYGKTYKTAWKNYREFVEAATGSSMSFPIEGIVGQAVLGRQEFVEKVVAGIGTDKHLKDIISKRFFIKAVSLDKLHQAVCQYYRVEDIAKGRAGGRVRDMFVYLAKRETAAQNSEIGQMAGGITYSAVTQRNIRTIRQLEQDAHAMEEWNKDAKTIMSKVKG